MHGFVNSDKRKLSDGAKSILSVNTISAAPNWEAPASWQIDAASPDICYQIREEGTEDYFDTTKLVFPILQIYNCSVLLGYLSLTIHSLLFRVRLLIRLRMS